MATIVNFFGAYGQTLSATPGAAFSWYTAGAATSLTIDATGGRNSKPAIKIQQTAAGSSIIGFDVAAGNRKVVLFGWFKINQLPTLASAVLLQTVGPATNPGVQVTTAGLLRAFAGATTQAYTGTLTVGQWYYICALVDASGTTFTIDWKVYDATAGQWQVQTQASIAGQTAADITGTRFGQNASAAQLGDATHDGGWFTDVGFSVTAADHPIPPVETVLIKPSGIGTHSVGSGLFTKTGSVAVTGADTNSYLEIDEQPPSATDWVAQTAIDAAAFLEYTRTYAAADARDPLAVKFYTEHQGAATGAYTMEVRARQNGVDSADITSGGTKSATTVVRRALCLALAPDGTAWTNAKAESGTRLRFGYSGDATPDAQLNAAFSEALMPVSLGTTSTLTISATGSSAVSAIKQPGLVRAAAATSAASVLKVPKLVRSVAAGSSSLVSKIPKMVRSVTGGATALALQTRIKVSLAEIATSAATLTVGKISARLSTATATGSSSASVVKRPGLVRSVSGSSSSAVVKQPGLVRSVAGSGAVSVLRRPGLVRAVAAGSSVVALQTKVTVLAITRTATSAVSLTKSAILARSVAAGSSLTVLALRTRLRLASVAASSTATVLKVPALVRLVTGSGSASVLRRPGLVRSVAAGSSILVLRGAGRVAAVAAGSSVTLRKLVARAATVAAGSAASASASVSVAVSMAAGSAVSTARRAAISMVLVADSAVSVIAALLSAVGFRGLAGRSNRIGAAAAGRSRIDASMVTPAAGKVHGDSDQIGRISHAPADSTGIIEGGD